MDKLNPLVTVVIGCHQDGPALTASLDSIVAQHAAPSWECLIVANGAFQSGDHLQQRLAIDSRFSLLFSPRQGLTEALILGCAQARGLFIARLDVGDAMSPDRLALQVEAICTDPRCVLATSSVEVCGPCWEHLWVNRGTESLAGVPTRVDQLPASQGIAMDIPHHSSVMIRRSAYETVGGYRSNFYFGQDTDLWYRLASAGSFIHLLQVLTRVRLFSGGLSSRHWREQRKILSLSQACYAARCQGKSENLLLDKAAKIRPGPINKSRRWFDQRSAEGFYFIAEALRRNADFRCRGYFVEAIKQAPWHWKAWLRIIQSFCLSLQR